MTNSQKQQVLAHLKKASEHMDVVMLTIGMPENELLVKCVDIKKSIEAYMREVTFSYQQDRMREHLKLV